VRKTKTVTETITHEVTQCIVCDLCGAESNQPEGWEKSIYFETKSEFRFVDIESYPGDYRETGMKADFCPVCAEKVAQMLISMGLKIENCKVETD